MTEQHVRYEPLPEDLEERIAAARDLGHFAAELDTDIDPDAAEVASAEAWRNRWEGVTPVQPSEQAAVTPAQVEEKKIA